MIIVFPRSLKTMRIKEEIEGKQRIEGMRGRKIKRREGEKGGIEDKKGEERKKKRNEEKERKREEREGKRGGR